MKRPLSSLFGNRIGGSGHLIVGISLLEDVIGRGGASASDNFAPLFGERNRKRSISCYGS